jgi:hypothetical protein
MIVTKHSCRLRARGREPFKVKLSLVVWRAIETFVIYFLPGAWAWRPVFFEGSAGGFPGGVGILEVWGGGQGLELWVDCLDEVPLDREDVEEGFAGFETYSIIRSGVDPIHGEAVGEPIGFDDG